MDKLKDLRKKHFEYIEGLKKYQVWDISSYDERQHYNLIYANKVLAEDGIIVQFGNAFLQLSAAVCAEINEYHLGCSVVCHLREICCKNNDYSDLLWIATVVTLKHFRDLMGAEPRLKLLAPNVYYWPGKCIKIGQRASEQKLISRGSKIKI